MPRLAPLTLLACPFALAPAWAQTPVQGPIVQDTTWTLDGSPYLLVDDAEVVRGAVLTIEAGVRVLGEPGVALFIGGEADADLGTLIVEGEAGQPVRFEAVDSEAGWWAGLRFRPGAVGASLGPGGEYLGGSVIRSAGFHFSQNGIAMDSSVAYLEDVTLSYAGAVRVMLPHDATDRVVARRVRVSNSATHGMHVFGGHSHIIQDCAFERNLDTGLSITGNGTIAIDATANCWGTTLPAAIAARIHDGADDPARGLVATDPIATTCGGCRADLDGDGELTIFDYLTFSGLFGLGDPAADFDGDGELTIFDFLAFQTAFDAGCP